MKSLRGLLRVVGVLILASVTTVLVLAQKLPGEGGAALTEWSGAFDSPVPNPGAAFVTGGGWIDSPAGYTLIANGSFETGDYTGWTVWEGYEYGHDPEAGTWGIAQDGQVVNDGDLLHDYFDEIENLVTTPSTPITFEASDGDYVAFNLQNGPQLHRMYQDLAIPEDCIAPALSWDMKYENHYPVFHPSAQYLAVHVRDTSDAIVETLYKTTEGVDPLSIPMTSFSRDISAYAGTTVRLDVELVILDYHLDVTALDNFVITCQGAYRPDPSLSGKATFGFVSKYKKGADTPTGNLEFQFHAADLNFHGSSQEWLSVVGSDYARFKGTGTINGQGEYKFMVWAGDGEPDTFRIKIWEEDAYGVETVIYDNGFDQALGKGSIVLHK